MYIIIYSICTVEESILEQYKSNKTFSQCQYALKKEEGISMLEVKELSKQIGSFRLDNISLHLPKGYIMGLIGENGAGKTTLIRCLLDIYHKDYGKVWINGISLDEDEAAAKSQLGVVLESSMYDENMSALDNARIYGGLFPDYDEATFLKYMNRFNVDTGKKLKKLSRGMEIKFQIALALSHNAKLIIMDEPAGNLDESSRLELSHIVQDFISDGERSVLLSTHITAQLEDIADYITYMHNGRILFVHDKESLAEEYILVSGEDYKIRLIPKELVIGIRKGKYATEALVKKTRRYQPNWEVTVSTPTIEQIMFYISSGFSPDIFAR